MNSRERKTLLILLGLVVLGGAALAYFFVYEPLQDKWAEADKIQAEVSEYESKVTAITAARPKLAQIKRQSLPPEINLAQAQYKLLLERLLDQAKVKDFTIGNARVLGTQATPDFTPPPAANAPAQPPGQLTTVKKTPAYQRLEFRIDAKKVNVWQVVDFLQGFYQADLLHQITEISVTRENKATESRNGLHFIIACEAIIVESTEDRPTLFAISNPAVGAVAGNLAVQAINFKPEVAQRVPPTVPVLSPRQRDYSFIALNDLFYGKLPDTPPDAFSVGRFEAVVIKKPEETSTVRVRVSGEGATGAKVVATASGSLLPEGPLTVDPKALTITIPKVSEELGSTATSTVSVVVTSGLGKEVKSSFKVSMGEAAESSPKPDISAAIRLSIVTGDSDGGALAVIKDAAGPARYEIRATPKSIEVTKWWQLSSKIWKAESRDHPSDVLAVSDDYSRTKRTFKVIAVENDAVIVADITKPEKADHAPAKGTGRPQGGGMGGPDRGARQGKAEPLAVVGSNLATAIPPPHLYRWSLGKSLKELESGKLTADEVKAVMQRVASVGPAGAVAVSGSGP